MGPAHRAPIVEPGDTESAQRAVELKRWMNSFAEWKQWSDQWMNRRERGWFTGYRERRAKPAPPAWLPQRCETAIDESDPLLAACGLLAQWQADVPATQMQQARATAVSADEASPRTVWWEHLHMDVLWPAMQWRASIYGVIGLHTATTIKGRVQIFTAPGVMLLNLPSRTGTRSWKFAANYGLGYRLFDFRFPGNRQAVLHVNLAKAWIVSDISDVAVSRSVDFAGFSVTFKKGQ